MSARAAAGRSTRSAVAHDGAVADRTWREAGTGALTRREGAAAAARLAAAATHAYLLASAFPPYEEGATAWCAVVPLILLARYTAPAQAWRWGWLGGFGFWLVTMSWLLRLAETGTIWPVAVLAWVSLSAYLALYTAAFVLAVSHLFAWKEARGGGRLWNLGAMLLIPVLWVGFEYLRGLLFTGFPWNALGVSQFRSLPIIQVAEWGGVAAVSAVVMVLNTAFALTILKFLDQFLGRVGRRELHFELMLGLMAWLACWGYGLGRLRDLQAHAAGAIGVQVAAVQPNIEQRAKWDEAFVTAILRKLEFQSELALAGSQPPALVVWPETSAPELLTADTETARLVRKLAARGTPLLVGSMEVVPDGTGERLYNSALLLDGQGSIAARYRKQHLVPFGEYVPLERLVPLLGRLAPLGFSCTPGAGPAIMRLAQPDVAFGCLICFEDALAYLSRRAVRAGAQFLVNQTNDGWFDPSCGSLQHVSHAVFRAVENRVCMVRAANTGISCFIAPDGRFEDIDGGGGRRTQYEGHKRMVVPVWPGRAPTLYTRFGDALLALPCGLAAAGSLALALWSLRQARQAAVKGKEIVT